MHCKIQFFLSRILQFYIAAYIKSLQFQSYYTTPKDCWFFFNDENFQGLSQMIKSKKEAIQKIRDFRREEINTFNTLNFEPFLNQTELYIPSSFHENTRKKARKIYINKLPDIKIDVPSLDQTQNATFNILRENTEYLIRYRYKFRYFLKWYFDNIYKYICKQQSMTKFTIIPGLKPFYFEFLGTRSNFYTNKPNMKKTESHYNFESFSTILPTTPPFVDVISKINFSIKVFEDEKQNLLDFLVGDRSYLTFYNVPFGRKVKNITITENSVYTIDNINGVTSSWFLIRRWWGKYNKKYTRYFNELEKWNFRKFEIAETLIEYFFCNIFTVNYMDPHIGRAINHYRRLLDIEFNKNGYLEEIYDTLWPRINYVENKWNLIIEALNVFENKKIFKWIKHTKTYYKPEPLIAPIFARLHNIPKLDFFFSKYYYPIYDKFKTSVLPYTGFRIPHFRRKILLKQDFAHNYHLQSFFRFARVLIKRGFKKRALRMLKYCLIHLKRKYPCYSSSNMLLGAVKIATPDLIAMPYKKGGRSEYSVIAARTIRHFSEGVRILYKGARFRRKHLDWGGEWFLGKKFEHVLAEEVIDVIKNKYDCMTLRIVRQLIIDLTQLGRSRYTRKMGVIKYSPYDFAQDSLKQIFFSKKSEEYKIKTQKEIKPFSVKPGKAIIFKDLDSKFRQMKKIRRLLYMKPHKRKQYTKKYGYTDTKPATKYKIK